MSSDSSFSISKNVRSALLDFQAYTPGEQPNPTEKIIKLNTNENPYPPSPHCQASLEVIWSEGLLRKYPNTTSRKLQEAIAKDLSLEPENVLVTNGSDEALRLLFYGVLEKGDTFCMPDPTYSHYPVLTEMSMVGASIQKVPVLTNFQFDWNSLKQTNAKLTAFANPNAPTGLLEPKSAILDFVRSRDGFVLCDEAYIDFAKPSSSMTEYIGKIPQLIVSRTFSKSYSLAGLRVGFLLASKELIELLSKTKDSYNLGIIEQSVALTSWEDKSYFQKRIKEVLNTREVFIQDLNSLGFSTLPSETNFVFTLPPKTITAEALYGELKKRNILVRYFPKGVTKDYIRITIGTAEEMKSVVVELKSILSLLS